jgi:hypothetical protein
LFDAVAKKDMKHQAESPARVASPLVVRKSLTANAFEAQTKTLGTRRLARIPCSVLRTDFQKSKPCVQHRMKDKSLRGQPATGARLSMFMRGPQRVQDFLSVKALRPQGIQRTFK